MIVDTADFHSSWDLLAFMAKDELIGLLNKVHAGMLSYTSKYCCESDHVSKLCKGSITKVCTKLRAHIETIATAGTKSATPEHDSNADHPDAAAQFNSTTKVQSRIELQAVSPLFLYRFEMLKSHVYIHFCC